MNNHREDAEGLKPCPFCGGEAHWPEPEVNIYYVGCKKCAACAQDERAWNTRAPDEALTAKIAGLEGALRPFADACDNCIDQEEPDRNHTWEHPVGMNVTVGDYRAARAALSPKDGQDQDAAPNERS